MYTRSVTIHLKPNSASEFGEAFERTVLPILKTQRGFTDEITFVSENGRDVLAISLWDRKEDANQYGRDAYAHVLKSLKPLIEGTPEVEAYSVGPSTFHQIASRG
jgi:heme-degrading monooxygenase HmoA